MLLFSQVGSNFELINFDHTVMGANMWEILGYWISENRVPFDKKGKSKQQRRPHPRSLH
jgi:hypothetical protein